MHRIETLPARGGPLGLSLLFAELQRSVGLIEADIRAEEERANAFDRSSATYPALARHLRDRRDNLLATISLLRDWRALAAA